MTFDTDQEPQCVTRSDELADVSDHDSSAADPAQDTAIDARRRLEQYLEHKALMKELGEDY